MTAILASRGTPEGAEAIPMRESSDVGLADAPASRGFVQLGIFGMAGEAFDQDRPRPGGHRVPDSKSNPNPAWFTP